MESTDKLKVACFGLQGFGNDLLLALHENDNVEITTVYTLEPRFLFNYYKCEPIESLAERIEVPVQYIPAKGKWDCGSADLAIISSFHRLLKRDHIEKFHKAVNIHPSLLPQYRGATPTNWKIKNGETIVGLTAHLVTESIDAGPTIYQRRVLNPYLNDNQLRMVLSFTSKEVVNEIISQFPDFREIKNNLPESYYPPRSESDSLAKLSDFKTIDELIFHIKAFTNYPMPKIEIEDSIFVIDYENPEETIQIELKGESFCIVGRRIND